MYEKLIEGYLNNLTKNDIVTFALKNAIKLNTLEIDYLYKTLKNNYQFLLGPNYEMVFKEAQTYLTKENYDKVFSLYLKYRMDYPHFFTN